MVRERKKGREEKHEYKCTLMYILVYWKKKQKLSLIFSRQLHKLSSYCKFVEFQLLSWKPSEMKYFLNVRFGLRDPELGPIYIRSQGAQKLGVNF
jgi:hypothetical protein